MGEHSKHAQRFLVEVGDELGEFMRGKAPRAKAMGLSEKELFETSIEMLACLAAMLATSAQTREAFLDGCGRAFDQCLEFKGHFPTRWAMREQLLKADAEKRGWLVRGLPAPGAPVRVLCADVKGTYELKFPCRYDGSKWVNANHGDTIVVNVIGWRAA